MADFVQLTEEDGNAWAMRPGPQRVQADQRKVLYLNEMSKLGDRPAEAVIAAGVQSYAPESNSEVSREVTVEKTQNAGGALLWPKTAWESKQAAPFVTAILGGLIVSPIVMPGQVITGYLLTGYVIGAVSQYLVCRAIPVQKAETPIEKFITSQTKKVDSAISSSQTADLGPAQPSSLQQQIADQQAVY